MRCHLSTNGMPDSCVSHGVSQGENLMSHMQVKWALDAQVRPNVRASPAFAPEMGLHADSGSTLNLSS